MLGKTIAHYRIMATLGSGGMSVVYKAQDTRLGRFVALKFLHERFCTNSRTREQFHQEARTASALNHPGICTIHDIGLHEDRPYIVMEYLQGETLRDRLRKRGLTMQEAIVCGIYTADALSQAHAAGVVHRDISPANLFLTIDGRVKLLDFGVATIIDRRAARARSMKTSCGLTGTIHYMSPEQARGQQVDARSDIFAVGLVLYEVLTGRRAFTGSNITAVINQIIHATPERVATLAPGVPEMIQTVVHKCLEKSPERRYQTAAELRDDLKSVALTSVFEMGNRPKVCFFRTIDKTECHELSAETMPDTMAER